jgi:hypothetical protein
MPGGRQSITVDRPTMHRMKTCQACIDQRRPATASGKLAAHRQATFAPEGHAGIGRAGSTPERPHPMSLNVSS